METCYGYILEYEKPEKERYYNGITNNPFRRWWEHLHRKAEKAAYATKRFGVKRVVCTAKYANRREALQEEIRTKERIANGWIPSESDCSYIKPRNIRMFVRYYDRFKLNDGYYDYLIGL